MDSLGRLGGDEFAIAVPGAGPAEAAEVAARVHAALAERVSVSAGMASFPADGSDPDALHRRADADLYAVKHGRSSSARGRTFASELAQAVTLRMAVPGEETSAVPHFAAAIASRLGFSDADFAMLRLAAILHDVGKVAVPERILRKPGPLAPDEYAQVKSHPGAGAEIVSRIDGLGLAAEWIGHSHEHLDGSGYPGGLSGEQIPVAARVLLVADAYDAMTGNRAYSAPLPPEVALTELQLGAGRQFDARCVDALAGYLADHPDEVLERAFVAKRFVRASPAIVA
jgi:HD-GYP domain-containing protein (c-di-GMP phosphodiesterase class II)